MAKTSAPNFDATNCDGCPHRTKEGPTDGGGKAVDVVADIEARAVEAVTGDEQFKCGLCGCPLVNLELVEQAPEQCPRIEDHGGEQ
jgi:hypothetical protein